MGIQENRSKRFRRHSRVRARVFGTSDRPRFSIFRSHKHVFAQLVDDKKGKTLVSASDWKIKKKISKSLLAKEVGILIAKKALLKKIKKVVFDRGGYKYHGRVRAVAEGAREGGLEF